MGNTKTHNSIVAQQKMNELHIERLPHPPYSPDISLNDFFFYGYFFMLPNIKRSNGCSEPVCPAGTFVI